MTTPNPIIPTPLTTAQLSAAISATGWQLYTGPGAFIASRGRLVTPPRLSLRDVLHDVLSAIAAHPQLDTLPTRR